MKRGLSIMFTGFLVTAAAGYVSAAQENKANSPKQAPATTASQTNAAEDAQRLATGEITKIDVKKKILVVNTVDGKKEYSVNDDTKFIGPKGGKSDKGLEDDRLVKGAELTLLIAGNNKTVREVHLPERK